MILQTHDQLETAFYIGSGIITISWGIVKWAYNDLKKTQETQWSRIDQLTVKSDFNELRHKTEAIEKDYISREYHEQFRREFKDDVQNAIVLAIAPLKVSIDNLTNQMGKINDRS